MTTDTQQWQATHRITFTPASGEPQVYEVMLGEDGAAYAREEWESDDSAAAWGVTDGEWLCEGQPTPAGQNGTVLVEVLPMQAAATGEEISDLDHDALDAIQAHCSEGSVKYRCQCGRWSGERCMWTGPRTALVHVKYVPDSDQGSATASGTGTYGAYAKSIYVSPECAELMRYRWEDGEPTEEEDEFVRVIGPAYDLSGAAS